MKTLEPAQKELIDAVLTEQDVGGLTPGIFEKDIHVTDAILAIAALQPTDLSLIFCGGTSLSKAHRLIERMSEDLDFKVVLNPALTWSQSRIRSRLSQLKKEVNACMESAGFVENPDLRAAQNANQYFASGWTYQPVYPHDAALRPEIQLEITARNPRLPADSVQLGYLLTQFGVRMDDNASALVQCISPAETLAEKVLSFLRRYAQFHAGAMRQDWDETLVRHIYDTYCIVSAQPDVTDDVLAEFPTLVTVDQQEFGAQFPAFAQNPAEVMRNALQAIEHDLEILQQYEERLMPLVYGKQKPSFNDAFATFKDTALKLLASLRD
ncbi:nucleotidyl transferase AbiEii/AbiGii toxin family protein [Achromobacter denitrificans]